MNIKDIKLVIWDLDDTFWKGTHSEGSVQLIQENITLVNNMLDAGVICSICSKNDEEAIKRYLKEQGLQSLFVFMSINWSPKGERVLQITKEMNLRQPNVLFIDDNISNRAEVKKMCPEMMVEDVDCLRELYQFFAEVQKKDVSRKRWAQYQLLEQKQAFKASYGTNEDFLKASNIRVKICDTCDEVLERIYELISRTNQLNFTKNRCSREELAETIQDSNVKTGYVQVTDNFGDYGIVGFFALQNNALLHFCFSCRTLNMGIEQYVYHYLGRPDIRIIGDVASDLSGDVPGWINQERDTNSVQKHNLGKNKILIKGPCDMSQMFAFIKETKNLLTEFVYVNDRGVSIEGGQHTVHIVQSRTVPQSMLQQVIDSVPFGDKAMYQTSIFDENIDVIIYSLFTDPNLGVYENKHSHVKVAFGEYTNDLTDQKKWPQYINQEIFTANCQFSEELLVDFRDNYAFLGRITPDEIVENLEFVISNIKPDTKLLLCLGSEMPYLGNMQDSYEDRHLYNRVLNNKVRNWAAERTNVFLIDVNHFISDQSDFTNNINHFQRNIYFELSKEIVRLVNLEDNQIRNKTDFEMLISRMSAPVKKIKKIPQKIRIFIHKNLVAPRQK